MPYHCPPVPVLMLHEAKSEDEKNSSDIREIIEQDPALLVTTAECEPKNITVARQVDLKAMCETPVLVSIQAAGVIEVNPVADIAKNHA